MKSPVQYENDFYSYVFYNVYVWGGGYALWLEVFFFVLIRFAHRQGIGES